ncbi:GFA family protein [Erythrobacter sp. W53]
MTAGPFSLSALYREDRFQLSSGDVAVGRCNSAGQHYFCEACFSWVYTRPGGLEGMVNIRTPMLEDAAAFPPFAEFFTQEILPGMTSGAPLSFKTAPSSAVEFLKLTDAYEQWDQRPA